MIRRGFLAALLGAPVAAPAMLGAAVAGPPEEYNFPIAGCSASKDPLWAATDGLRRKLFEERFDHLGEPFSDMKSWSKSFRMHVYAKEQRRLSGIRRRYDRAMDDRDIRALLAIGREVGATPSMLAELVRLA